MFGCQCFSLLFACVPMCPKMIDQIYIVKALQQIIQLKKEKTGAESRLREAEEEMIKYKGEHKTAISDLRSEIASLKKAAEEEINNKNLAKEQHDAVICNWERALDHCKDENFILKEEAKKKNIAISLMHDKVKECETYISTLEKNVDKGKDTISILKEELEKRNGEISKLVGENQDYSYILEESKKKDRTISKLEEETKEKDRTISTLDKDAQEKGHKISNLMEETKKKDRNISTLEEGAREKDHIISNLKEEARKRDDAIFKLKEKFDGISSSISTALEGKAALIFNSIAELRKEILEPIRECRNALLTIGDDPGSEGKREGSEGKGDISRTEYGSNDSSCFCLDPCYTPAPAQRTADSQTKKTPAECKKGTTTVQKSQGQTSEVKKNLFTENTNTPKDRT
uniref:Uncharacterized protein n=1 Tax=Palpitomonas bilix TaxID=652834 RepID=A0A7S3GK23_9EUKA|mmetsp:Transcript_6748/g.16968  ORF Transcript_6748/g.16968 Transcript_6748/m.16968 type:complete len:403 (+) Transcript_6748:864-2072(+)